MNNLLNKNEIYPILDMIRREMRRHDFARDRQPYVQPQIAPPDDSDKVTKIEKVKGGNLYDPSLIDAVVLTYQSGRTEHIVLQRGANPAVPNSVENYQYYNNALIVGVTITLNNPDGSPVSTTTVVVVREDGYGSAKYVNINYS